MEPRAAWSLGAKAQLSGTVGRTSLGMNKETEVGFEERSEFTTVVVSISLERQPKETGVYLNDNGMLAMCCVAVFRSEDYD